VLHVKLCVVNVTVIMVLHDAFNFVLQNPLVTGTIEYVKVIVRLRQFLYVVFQNDKLQVENAPFFFLLRELL
jgi:hypothetical protein